VSVTVKGPRGRSRGSARWWRIPRTKIAIPEVPTGFVDREPLTELFQIAAGAGVLLVCAPAGYGKTVLLADGMRKHDVGDTAWISLDSDDNDPGRFWAALLAAVRECPVVPPESPLHGLAPKVGHDEPGFLADLIDGLDVLPQPVRVVLDDLQEVVSRNTLRGIGYLLRHQPRGLRLVLSSRVDPPLPLARLRVDGALVEIRADRLRFGVQDATALLTGRGVELSQEQTGRLVALSEGWAAGLQLAALSLRETGAPDDFLTAFPASDRPLADYLAGEVLDRLPRETVEFLRVISVVDQVTSTLAEALTLRRDAGAILGRIERDTSLVTSVVSGSRWYRVQPLLRAYLRGELTHRRSELTAALHRRASTWFAAQGDLCSAFEHACLDRETTCLQELIRRHAVALILAGDHEVVRHALGMVGVGVVARDARVALASALLAAEDGDFGAADADLQRAEAASSADGEVGQVALLHRLVASRRAIVSGCSTTGIAADGGAADSTVDDPALAAWVRSDAGCGLVCSGDREAGRRELEAGLQMSRHNRLNYLTAQNLVALGVVHALNGDHCRMEAASAEAAMLADERGWRNAPWLASCEAVRAYAALMRLDPAEAWECARRASERSVEQPCLQLAVALVHGAAQFDQADRSDGLRVLDAARRRFGHVPAPKELVGGALRTSHDDPAPPGGSGA
jgi:LuxR family maltose regulon positive regulatory protein